jgi:hypothetical protein
VLFMARESEIQDKVQVSIKAVFKWQVSTKILE